MLGQARKVGYHQDSLIVVAAQESQHLSILRLKELKAPPAKGFEALP